jgi:hypothetical protein
MSIKIQIDKEEITLSSEESKKFIANLELENQQEQARLDLLESKRNQIISKLNLTDEEVKILLG